MAYRNIFLTSMIALVALGAIAQSPDESEATKQGPTTAWSTIAAPHFTVHYDPKCREDADRAVEYLHRAIASLRSEFAGHGPDEILGKIECHLYLHSVPNEKASDGTSVCITRGLGGGRRHAELHFLTPTRRRPGSVDSMGELKDENHFYRYLVHEYSSIWLGIIARSKQNGWYVNDDDGPNWFWQGYEEYLGMIHSSDHSRTVTFAKYMAVLNQNPERVQLEIDADNKTLRLGVEGDYTDGFALLAFMHDQFGKEQVQALLTSERDTFNKAMHEVLEIDLTAFHERFQQWVDAWEPTASQ